MRLEKVYPRVLLCIGITAGLLYTTEGFAKWINVYNGGNFPIVISKANLTGCANATLAPDMQSPVTINKNAQASLANVLSGGTCIISFKAASQGGYTSTTITANGNGPSFNTATASRHANFYTVSAAKTTIYVKFATCLSGLDWSQPSVSNYAKCVTDRNVTLSCGVQPNGNPSLSGLLFGQWYNCPTMYGTSSWRAACAGCYSEYLANH